MQKHGHGDVFSLKAMEGCGDESDIALLLARASASSKRVPAPSPTSRLTARLLAARRPLLAAGALLLGWALWALLAPELAVSELLEAAVAAAGLSREEPGLLETAELWLAGLLTGLLCWLPGVCSSGQPVCAGSLWAVARKLMLF